MYQWEKGLAKWQVGDTLYISIPFTWLVKEAEKTAKNWKGKVLMGGPGLMKPTYCEGFSPVLFHNPAATYTTRGCPNRCPFCAVYKLEPDFIELTDYRPAPVICDNNFTAATRKHQEMVIYRQRIYPLTDFNQGLEASRFTPELADLLGMIKCRVRFAFDSWDEETEVYEAIKLCRQRSTDDIGVYCLIGFDDTPEDARARLELVRSWDIRPNPMRYQPLDAEHKNDYILPGSGWTEYEMRRIMKYYSRLRWYEHIPFEEFRWLDGKMLQAQLFQS